jgi:hypothetical protein
MLSSNRIAHGFEQHFGTFSHKNLYFLKGKSLFTL